MADRIRIRPPADKVPAMRAEIAQLREELQAAKAA
jgi:hypothetical protein